MNNHPIADPHDKNVFARVLAELAYADGTVSKSVDTGSTASPSPSSNKSSFIFRTVKPPGNWDTMDPSAMAFSFKGADFFSLEEEAAAGEEVSSGTLVPLMIVLVVEC